MKKWSHRQYLTTLEWLDKEWDTPNRTDHYLMQIAVEVARTKAKNPSSVKMEHMKLRFKDTTGKNITQDDIIEATKRSKSAWMGKMTVPIKVIDEEGNESLVGTYKNKAKPKVVTKLSSKPEDNSNGNRDGTRKISRPIRGRR